MNWHVRIRDAFAARGPVPDADIIEELSQHAALAFQRARADGSSQDAAERQVQELIDSWTAEAKALRPRSRHAAAIELPVSSR